MKPLLAALALVLVAGCGGGGGDSEPAADPAPTQSVAVEPTPEPTPEPEPAEPSTISEIQSLFPKGYPKVVAVSTLPDQVRSWYDGDYTQALAIAPGVWAGMSPGAEPFDVFAAGVYDGFCPSVKAYERKYLEGVESAGVCW